MEESKDVPGHIKAQEKVMNTPPRVLKLDFRDALGQALAEYYKGNFGGVEITCFGPDDYEIIKQFFQERVPTMPLKIMYPTRGEG